MDNVLCYRGVAEELDTAVGFSSIETLGYVPITQRSQTLHDELFLFHVCWNECKERETDAVLESRFLDQHSK
jgi:hypothetical protein